MFRSKLLATAAALTVSAAFFVSAAQAQTFSMKKPVIFQTANSQLSVDVCNTTKGGMKLVRSNWMTGQDGSAVWAGQTEFDVQDGAQVQQYGMFDTGMHGIILIQKVDPTTCKVKVLLP